MRQQHGAAIVSPKRPLAGWVIEGRRIAPQRCCCLNSAEPAEYAAEPGASPDALSQLSAAQGQLSAAQGRSSDSNTELFEAQRALLQKTAEVQSAMHHAA